MTPEAIAVLRPSAVGDFVFALPALRALRETWPEARLVYLGRAWHAAFLEGRGVVDEVVVLPSVPGITAPADGVEDARVEAFCAAMRARRFALALQLYGGGRFANPLVKRLGARRAAGLCASDAEPLDVSLPYVELTNERRRLLDVVALAGARGTAAPTLLPVLDSDRAALQAGLEVPGGDIAVLQPGATDPRRRWSHQRFAALGDALAAAGASVVVQGGPDERALTAAVVQAMRRPALDAGGRLSLSGLVALLAQARLVVSNDTGPLHLADAVGTPTVGIYWHTNALVSAPTSSPRHRYAVSHRLHCPVCGAENVTARCAHDPSFVDDVPVEEVLSLALRSWQACDGRAAPPPAAAPRSGARRPDPKRPDAARHPAGPSDPTRMP